MLTLALLVLTVDPLVAEPAPPREAISMEIPGMFSGGFELNAEHRFATHFSALAALGTRTSLEGDYRSAGFAAGVGARYWLDRWVFPSMKGVGGPVVTLRFDLNWVAINRVGTTHELDEAVVQLSLRVGYRLVFFGHIELTLEAGPGGSFMLDGGPFISSGVRTDVVYGLTAGYLF
jgi:hypothetical protein